MTGIEAYRLLGMTPEEIRKTAFPLNIYRTALAILRQKAASGHDEEARIDAVADKIYDHYYPWMELVRLMASDMAKDELPDIFDADEILRYYRAKALNESPTLRETIRRRIRNGKLSIETY